jgi:hypothetical protein
MKTYQVVDGDSQFTGPMHFFPKPWVPDEPILALFQQGKKGPRHSIFGEHHNVYPLAAGQLNAEQVAKVLEDLERVLQKEQPHIIAFPNDSTIHSLVPRVFDKLGGKPMLLSLNPAFRRQSDCQLRAELNVKQTLPVATGTVRVLFLDDSYTSGRTEEKAIDAVLDVLRRMHRTGSLVDWYSYVLVDRTNQGPQVELPRKRSPRHKRERVELKLRKAYVCLGPRSAHRGDCPLCAAGERMTNAIGWSVGTRAEIRTALDQAQALFTTVQLDTHALPEELIAPEINQALLFLFSQNLPTACFHITEKKFEKPADMAAALLFLAFNWADSCAFLPQDKLASVFQLVVREPSLNDAACAHLVSIATAFLPSSIQCEILQALLPDLVREGRLASGGALIALTLSGLSELQLEYPKSVRNIDQPLFARIFASVVHELGEQLDRLGATAELFPHCEVLKFDLATLKERPKTSSHLWCVRMLTAVLHEGKHASFLMHELTAVTNPRLPELKSNVAQCVTLFRLFLKDIAPKMAVDLEPLSAEVEAAPDIESLRPIALGLIQRFWSNYIEKEYVMDAQRIENLLKQARHRVRSDMEDLEVDFELFEIQPAPKDIWRWKSFAPHWEILQGHFENMFGNAIKYFNQQRPTDIAAHCRSLLKDPTFNCGHSVIYVTHIVASETGFYYILFSDRAASAEGKNLLGWYSGLSSARALLQLKGGDLMYFSAADVARGLPAEWAPLEPVIRVLPARYVNHFVTRLPLLLAFK